MGLIPRKRASSGRYVERFVLTLENATLKKVTLANTPESANKVVVDSPNGPVQNINQDYIVTGNDVSWDGYGLETILEEGDILIITYS